MNTFEVRDISYNIQSEIQSVKDLLEIQGLQLDSFVEKTIGVYDADILVATGSIAGNTLRSLCVHSDYRGTNVINMLVSHLLTLQYSKDCTHLFIYTKVDAYRSFINLGFHLITKTDSNIALLENKPNGIYDYLESIKVETHNTECIGSIVMNGNPFTKGHRYLIEEAKKHCDKIYLFVVWEQSSTFPNDVRYKLIEEGTKDLEGIILCKGKDYIISKATFPTYFLKESTDAVQEHAKLDLTIFKDIIAPYLGITKRFVGEERLCPTTHMYNQTMINMMKNSTIEVTQIKRKEENEDVISASHVRRFIKENRWDDIKKIVPETTYTFLTSKEAVPIINNIHLSQTRH